MALVLPPMIPSRSGGHSASPVHGDAPEARIGIRRSLIRLCSLALGHLCLFSFIFWAAFAIRFDFSIPAIWFDSLVSNLPWILSVKLGIYYLTGHFYGWWRYVTMADLAALLRAVVLSLIALVMIDYFLLTAHLPRSILLLDGILSIVCLGALRASWRLLRELRWLTFGEKDRHWALLVGSDHAAGVLAHQMQSLPQSEFRIRGLLDCDPGKVGTRLGRLPILGTPEDLGKIANAHGITDVFVIAGSLPGKRLRFLMDACADAQLALKIVPPAEELFRGNSRIPTRDIEINDLLRRDPVELDSQSIGALLQGKTVLITGAGGSIGSELCRQVLKFEPRELVLVGKGENRIFFIERELQALKTQTQLIPKIADITDTRRMKQIFQEYRPEVVFHAAAHKHVPLMEANSGEAVKNNVLGTRCVAELAHQFGAQNFVLISSDKAVNPANVMGATKNLAERYVMALAERSSTRFLATRFGNVLGSAGSVVPIFQEQIRRGGPITLTDQRMTRYFMTIPEASQLVLQAAALGKGGEIFVLDMGEPVRIIDLALDMIRLSGLPEHAIEIVFSGIRPGEKLYEELYFDDEETNSTTHAKIRSAYHRMEELADIRKAVRELAELADGPQEAILQRLHDIVPEFQSTVERAQEPAPEPHPSLEAAETVARQHVIL